MMCAVYFLTFGLKQPSKEWEGRGEEGMKKKREWREGVVRVENRDPTF